VEDTLTYILVSSGRELLGVYAVDSGEDDLGKGMEAGEADRAAVKIWGQNVERTLRSFETLKARPITETVLYWNNERLPELSAELAAGSLREIQRPALGARAGYDEKSFEGLPYNFGPLAGIAERETRPGHAFNVDNIWFMTRTPEYGRKMLLGGLAYFVLGLGVLSIPMLKVDQERKQLISRKAELVQQISDLDTKTRTLEEERAKARLMRKNLLDQANIVSRIKQFSWADVFVYLNTVLPEDVWLSAFSMDKNGALSVSGSGLSMDAVAKFLRGLEKNEHLYNVEMTSTTQRMIDKVNAVDFRIEASVTAAARESR
jgi:Tfp pilus assembly protein PilN